MVEIYLKQIIGRDFSKIGDWSKFHLLLINFRNLSRTYNWSKFQSFSINCRILTKTDCWSKFHLNRWSFKILRSIFDRMFWTDYWKFHSDKLSKILYNLSLLEIYFKPIIGWNFTQIYDWSKFHSISINRWHFTRTDNCSKFPLNQKLVEFFLEPIIDLSFTNFR